MPGGLASVTVSAAGLVINGHGFDQRVPLERYQEALGLPDRTISAGPPAPAGHRNNQVHLYDSEGIYLTEHHASRLIESVNLIFDVSESPFPLEHPFRGSLTVDGRHLDSNVFESECYLRMFARDLPGEFHVKLKYCWLGVAVKGRRNSLGKRQKKKHVVRVSICP